VKASKKEALDAAYVKLFETKGLSPKNASILDTSIHLLQIAFRTEEDDRAAAEAAAKRAEEQKAKESAAATTTSTTSEAEPVQSGPKGYKKRVLQRGTRNYYCNLRPLINLCRRQKELP